MRKQQQIWQDEHKNSKILPSLAESKPSSAVVYFFEFLKKSNLLPSRGKVVDIGCGKGRNSVFIARQALDVFAIDYIPAAIVAAKELAKNNLVDSKIKFFKAALDSPWQFMDNFFDLAVDCFSSIDIETKQGREICKQEMKRTLKPGGVALVAVVSNQDDLEKEIMANNPGPEKNSVIWPNGKFQKNYDEQELRKFYKEFNILELKIVSKPATKLGKTYMATNMYLILQKSM